MKFVPYLQPLEYPHYNRMDPHNMPPGVYEWERFYLAPVEQKTEKETPERFRQRAFSMYCWQGHFPPVMKAYAKRHEVPVGLAGCDVNESFKKTGDYHIFRSGVSADGKKFAPVEVICVSFPLIHSLHSSKFPHSLTRCAQFSIRRLSSVTIWFNY